jgi:hypothetical protein
MKKLALLFISFSFLKASHAQFAINGDNLDINNIKARINSSGDLFWDFINPKFEVPQGSGTGTIFADNLWIGGIDAGGNLKMAAHTYRQIGLDFWPGPLDSMANTNNTVIQMMNKVWKLNRCDIENYHFWAINGMPGSCPVDSLTLHNINTWPAVSPYGNPLAPYFDYNGDNFYDPSAGDYPLIKGDQAIFFVYNDKGGVHTETGGAALGVEIQTMAYAYDCPDSALQNAIFVNYKIINKSAFQLNNVFIGKWTDLDIGTWGDDHVGCDVSKGAFFGYNADSVDEGGYEFHPGAQGVVFLKGASADSNGVDDLSGGNANGSGYGDGIIDNEEMGMTRFMFYDNNSNPVTGYPDNANDFYDYMRGYWLNGSSWTYGGNGTSGGVTCDFMFPGSSDPSGYGIHSGIPQPPWDQSMAISFTDIKGLGSTGPFTFQPGAMQEFEVAYVFGRDYSALGASAGVDVMKARIDSIRARYANGIMGCCSSLSTGIQNMVAENSNFKLYPNPASSLLYLDYSTDSKNITIEIYDVRGQLLKEVKMNSVSKQVINIETLSEGLYILKLNDGKNKKVQRFIKQ